MIKLKSATGKLFKCTGIDPASPELWGWLKFALGYNQVCPPLHLDGSAWIKIRDGRLRYSLQFCGLIGYLVRQSIKFDGDPDYVGILGLDEEFTIEGWNRTGSDGEEDYIELKVFERIEDSSSQVEGEESDTFI